MKLSIGSIALENVAAEADGLIGVGAATFSDTKVEFTGPDNKTILIEIPKSGAEDWYVSVLATIPRRCRPFAPAWASPKK